MTDRIAKAQKRARRSILKTLDVSAVIFLLFAVMVVIVLAWRGFMQPPPVKSAAPQVNIEMVATLQAQIDALRSELDTVIAAQSVPAPVPAPDPPTPDSSTRQPVGLAEFGFVRDESVPLVDQTHNPGALNLGVRAARYGAEEGYLGTKGQETAVFPHRVYGIAALINLIRQFDGISLKHYLCGGGSVVKWKSYTGGDADRCKWFLEVFADQIGLMPDIKIDFKNVDMIEAMVRVHAHAEGSLIIITDGEWSDAFSLEQSVQ